MPRVLYVEGSPRGESSVSSGLARAFFEAHRAADPGVEVDHLNVWTEDLPPFAGEAANGKLRAMSGVPLPPEEQEAFNRALVLVARLKAADKVVLSTGMWNFGLPYRLKQWVDLVLQGGHTFRFDPMTGYTGLVTGRPLQLLISTGGDYVDGPLAAMDVTGPYLQRIFTFMGFEDIRVVTASCTAFPPEVSGPVIARAMGAAVEAGREF